MPRILVVDDDGGVRDVIIAMLEGQGYEAVAAGDGVAMRDILSNGSAFQAVILDSVMPGERSAVLASHAQTLRLPVIMISGNPEAMQFAHDGHRQLLAKPFSIQALVEAVENALTSGQFGQREDDSSL